MTTIVDSVRRGRPARAVPTVAVVLAVVAGASAVGCVPSDPASFSDVAIRRTDAGVIEALPCTGEELEYVRFVRSERIDDETNEWDTLWEVRIDPGRQVDSIILGEVPEGAEETVAFRSEELLEEPGVRFVFQMSQSNGNQRANSFTVDELDDGTVVYGDELLSAEEFAERDPCG